MSSSNKHLTVTPVAKAIPFDNSMNGFTSTDVQSAIEEMKTSGLKTKSGIVLAASFSGNPKKYSVAFVTAFPDVNYSIEIKGVDVRVWSYDTATKTASGFVINANANQALTGEVSWECIYQGEGL